MSASRSRLRLAAAAFTLAGASLLGVAGTASAAPRSSAGCTAGMAGADYQIAGSGYKAGTMYFVQITVPGGDSFVAPAVADANGNWTTSWLPTAPGTYSAQVFTTHWVADGSCSLVV